MSADLVWTTGGDKAATFHALQHGDRYTVCGRPTGTGPVLPRADAEAAGLTECRSCFGHAERRKPIIEGRRNDG